MKSAKEIKNITKNSLTKDIFVAINPKAKQTPNGILIGNEKSCPIALKDNRNTLIIDDHYYTKKSNLFAKNIEVLSGLSVKHNFVVLTDSDKVIEQSEKILNTQGYKVLIYDLTNPDKSHKFNPLKDIYREYSSYIKDKQPINEAIQKVAGRVFDFVEAIFNDKKSPLYKIQIDLFAAFLLGMLEDDYSLGTYNLESFYTLIQKKNDFDAMDKWFSKKCDYTTKLYNNFGSLNLVTKKSCYSKFIKDLAFLKDKAVHRFLAKNHFEIDEFVNCPTAIFIKHYNGKHYFNYFINILLDHIVKQYIGTINEQNILKTRPTHIMIENVFSAGNLKILPYLAIIGRSRNIALNLRLDNTEELMLAYPDEYEHLLNQSYVKLLLSTTPQTISLLCSKFRKPALVKYIHKDKAVKVKPPKDYLDPQKITLDKACNYAIVEKLPCTAIALTNLDI